MKKYIFIILTTFLAPDISIGQFLFPDINLTESEGFLNTNNRNYKYYHYGIKARIYNTQNITSSEDTTFLHPIYSQYDECRRGYLNKISLVSALKQIFTPARRQQLVNEYINIDAIIFRSTGIIKEIEFGIDKTTKMTLEEIFQLENLLKSQIHYQNPDDLWCQPYKMTYLFADMTILFVDIQ